MTSRIEQIIKSISEQLKKPTSDVPNPFVKFHALYSGEEDINFETNPGDGYEIRRGSEIHKPTRTETGIPDLDALLHGGWQEGVNLIYGKPGVGKSLVAAMTMSHLIRQGVPVACVDSEHTSYNNWSKHLPLAEAWLVRPDSNPFLVHGTDIRGTVRKLRELTIYAHQINAPLGLIVIDSLDAMLSRREGEEATDHGWNEYGNVDNSLERKAELEFMLTRLNYLGRHYHFPVLIIKQDHELTYGQGDEVVGEDYSQYFSSDPITKALEQHIHTTTQTKIFLTCLDATPDNSYSLVAPHITPGQVFTRSSVPIIDYEAPTHFLLGASVYSADSSVFTVRIPFAAFSNFNYIPPTSTRENILRDLTLGLSTGMDDEPYDKEGTTHSGDLGNQTGGSYVAWNGSEASERRPTDTDKTYTHWE